MMFDRPSSRHFFGVVPVFLVDDVAAAAEHYRDVFGFSVEFLSDDDAAYGRVVRGDVIIDFRRSDPPGGRNGLAAAGMAQGADALIVVSDIEDVYVELQEHGAKVVERLAVREDGMLECTIEDLNGYRITIGGGFEGDMDEEDA
jgi:uncharacterized glyoxalase superfamily protein PhnB